MATHKDPECPHHLHSLNSVIVTDLLAFSHYKILGNLYITCIFTSKSYMLKHKFYILEKAITCISKCKLFVGVHNRMKSAG